MVSTLKVISILLCSSFWTQYGECISGEKGLLHSSDHTVPTAATKLATATRATRTPTETDIIDTNLGGFVSHVMKVVTPIIQKIGVNATTTHGESHHHGKISLRRHLDVGDFEEINEILEGAVISIPDQTVTANALFTLTLDLKNLKCFAFSVGDIVINYILDNNQRLQMTLDVIELGLTCSLNYDYRYSSSSGSGEADAFTDNSSAKLSFSFESSDFTSRPPSNFNLKSCGNEPEDSRVYIDVTDIDLRGEVVSSISMVFNELIATAIKANVEDIGCSAIVDEVDPLGTELIDTANELINPYLEQLSAEYADPLYAEKTLVVPETMDLLDFGDVKNELGDLVTFLADAVSEFLSIGQGSDTTDISNVTSLGNESSAVVEEKLKINKFIREFLLEDRALLLNVSDLDLEFAPDGIIYEGEDELTYTKIILENIKIYGLDTFTAFDPLSDIGKYTLQSNVGLSYLEVEATLVIDIQPSTPGSEGVLEQITIRAGVEDVAATVSAFLAIDQEKLESLTLGNLLDIERLPGCLLSTIFGAKITGFNVTVGNIRQPVTAGFISVGIDRILSNVVDPLFIMYEAVILKALPNIFQTLFRNIINNDLIASFLDDPDNTICTDESSIVSTKRHLLEKMFQHKL